MSAKREARIRAQAYLLWEQEGRPDGRELSHWLRAEREVAPESRFPGWSPEHAAWPEGRGGWRRNWVRHRSA